MKSNAFQIMQAMIANHTRNAQFMKILNFQFIFLFFRFCFALNSKIFEISTSKHCGK